MLTKEAVSFVKVGSEIKITLAVNFLIYREDTFVLRFIRNSLDFLKNFLINVIFFVTYSRLLF